MEDVKGIIFDYGGTLDTDSVHWAHVLWDAYQAEGVGVTWEQFRECYVHGERALAREPLIRPEHDMLDLLRTKADVETRYLVEKGYLKVNEVTRRAYAVHISVRCYNHVCRIVRVSREVVSQLALHYPLVLVSNFYGNINTILHDFRLDTFFPPTSVIESAVVGLRKPDPRIFSLGVERLGLRPEEVLVVGDSFDKDILPATSIGCKTVWFKGKGWDDKPVDESIPTAVISDLRQLPEVLVGP